MAKHLQITQQSLLTKLLQKKATLVSFFLRALLNSLSLGFRIAAINEKANEVRKILSAVKSQYDTFSGVLAKAKKKIDEAGKSLDEAQHRNDMIQKRLRSIEALDISESDSVLYIESETPDFVDDDE